MDPGPPGTVEGLRITGLAASTTYYFALRVLDEFGNTSPVSNVVSETTLGPPELTVSPDSFSVDLFTGGTDMRTLDRALWQFSKENQPR